MYRGQDPLQLHPCGLAVCQRKLRRVSRHPTGDLDTLSDSLAYKFAALMSTLLRGQLFDPDAY